MSTEEWIKNLREKRIEYGVSQNKLALSVGITREYLNKIESGKTIIKNEMKEKLIKSLERFNPELPLTMMIDYIRIRFPTTDVKNVVNNILKLKLEYMIHEDYGFYSYSEHYVIGNIFVLVSQDIEKGVLIELKGQGCRQFENFLLAQHRSWYDFLLDALLAGGVMKRMDLAINDMTGILDIKELTNKCNNEECISVFRSFKSYRSGELVRKNEKIGMGNTLYIGSLKSEVYFCIYEKDYEQYIKLDIPIDEAKIKNRFEIRLKNERAYHAAVDLLANRDAEKTAFSIINRYIRFVDKNKDKGRSEWKTNEHWNYFIGEGREKLKLTTSPEPYNINKTLNWLSRQVAPTLKIIKKLDNLNNTTLIEDLIKYANLTDRHKKIIEQNSVNIENIIYDE
ncbi:helix-turn-helix family protein [Clostridioides difficile CD149]|uniref:Replication initiation factor n=1 Tax=Clostridioides difficile TaxID=1496 RepID=A0AB74QDB8_CLODI|nr:MobT family relaxase [Clostridioides difficile]OFU33425.1 Cro/Cl family transcriptional regulator [Clostridium sp. HMSC19B12]AXU26421.1 conjugative transposon replication initiation factor [Clostridioides difficile]AXU30281.1 conjugative transposon replication initiation factor [Clostridioides difficile]AXU34069.1 conjugative transposon replication initiation factor [Clostridioides difficile]EGT3654781.1 XRE family transcriptional regulator [Clostridioides difficile]